MADHNTSGTGPLSIVIVALTWLFNVTAMVTKDNVSFAMGLIVSTLACWHYILSIRKNTKK